MTTVWVFVGLLTMGSSSIDVCPDMKYVFATKRGCEYAIEGSKNLRCIQLQVSYANPS